MPTTILVNEKDSLGQPLEGFVRVTLLDVLSSGQTNYIPVAGEVILVSGQATLVLEPSGSERVSYLFEIFEYVPPVPNSRLVYSFTAQVPDSITPIALNNLKPSSIHRYNFDSGVNAISRRLYNDPDFWDTARQNLFRTRGVYSPSAYYRNGDIVTWQGSSYLCTAEVNITAIAPNDPLNWQLLASVGAAGAGTTGEDFPYDATGWNGVLAAPSKNTVRDVVETLATKVELAAKANLNAPQFNLAYDLSPMLPTDVSGRLTTSAWVQGLIDTVKQSLCPIGLVASYAGGSAPARWLLCDGRTVSRTTYAALFTVIGTTYGVGDGTTTFNLPDLRGRVAVGPDDMSALMGPASRVTSNNTPGASAGAQTHTLTIAETPAHTHNGDGGALIRSTGSGGTHAAPATGTAWSNANQPTSSVGSGLAHNNMQPYQVLNHIIFTGV